MNKGLYIILAVLIVVLIFLNSEGLSFLNKISQISSQNQSNSIKNLEIQDCSIKTE